MGVLIIFSWVELWNIKLQFLDVRNFVLIFIGINNLGVRVLSFCDVFYYNILQIDIKVSGLFYKE